MAYHVDLDVVEGCRTRINRQNLEIERKAVVSGIPITCTTGSDPNVLLNAIGAGAQAAGLPAPYTLHPNPLYPAILEEYSIDSVRAVDTVIVMMIYRLNLSINPTTPNWMQDEETITYQTETYTTSNGSNPLIVYYKSGLGVGSGGSTPPSTAHARIGKARKIKKYKVLRVHGRMYLNAWLTYKAGIEAAELKINSDTWGAYTRGNWMYLGNSVRIPLVPDGTPSSRIVAELELRFLRDPDLHYALLVYLNERREHPKDAISETALRGLGLPAAGNIITTNGKTLASIYPEAAFTPLFTFTPL